ncbi:MAG: ATP-binding protein [Verrucomicrobiota bacterium]
MDSHAQNLELNQPDFWRQIARKTLDIVYTLTLPSPIILDLPRSKQIEGVMSSVLSDFNQGFLEAFFKGEPDSPAGSALKNLFDFQNPERQYLVKKFLDGHFEARDIRITDKVKSDESIYTLNNWHGIVEEGALVAIIGCARIITDEVTIYKSLKRSEEALQLALDGASMGIFQWMNNGIFLDYRAAEIMAAPDSAYSVGYDGFNRLHPDDSAGLEATFSECLKSMEPFCIAFRVLAKSGDIRWVEMSGRTSSESNLDCHFIGTLQDITNRKRSEHALQEAKEHAESMNRMKTSFLANMSHEMRTPLNAIIGFAELMAEDNLTPEHQDFLSMMIDSGQRLLSTINSVLDVSRIEGGHVEVELKQVNLQSEIEGLLALHHPQARKQGLYLEYVHNAPKIPIHTDRSGLGQILQSLVDNALKFTHQGGVTLRSFQANRENKEYICISVKDTGIGMDEEFINNAFDSFKQESEGYQRAYEGSGLGLSLVRKWTHLLHGEIELKSLRGEGTEFLIYLPLTRFETQSVANNPLRSLNLQAIDFEEPEAPRSNRILVVEDDRINALLTERYLEKTYSVDKAANFEEAIQKTREIRYDLILLDIHLSDGHTGLDILKEVRNSELNARTKTIATTAYAMNGDRENLLSKGFNEYISKPFTRGDLLASIDKVFR